MLNETLDIWKRYLKSFDNWKQLTAGISPKQTGCGDVYEIPNPLHRSNESFAIADMCKLAFSEPHYHPETEMYIILQGTGIVVVGNKEQLVTKDSTVIIPPNVAHFTIPKENLVLAVINTPPFNAHNYHLLTKSKKSVFFDKKHFKKLISSELS